jgi:hypothetical protein
MVGGDKYIPLSVALIQEMSNYQFEIETNRQLYTTPFPFKFYLQDIILREKGCFFIPESGDQ